MAKINRDYSEGRLAELRESLGSLSTALSGHPLCVYATGSYGRLEAYEESDIDLFFLYDGDGDGEHFPLLKFIELAAHLIDKTRTMDFPEFSADGKYLDVLYVDEIERVLGSPSDDSLNAFTARMLLLLESQPVYDEALYHRLLERILSLYFRDFADHPDTFVPTFLLNDILRFWRTLTLNYEHDRRQVDRLAGAAPTEAKAKSALKNYKLKVSRMATCHSMVLHLASMPAPVRLEDVAKLCRFTPTSRFAMLRERGGTASSRVDRLARIYGSFLETVQRPAAEVLADFAVAEKRDEFFAEARAFGDEIFELLKEIAVPERFRYLVI